MHKVSATPREAGAVQAMLLMLAALLPIMGTLTMLPVMPLLFSHFAAQPHAQLLVPMIITIPAASMALLAPLAGMVGDRLSRRRLLIAATALYAGFGLLPVMLDDLYAILLARLVMGIADAFILTTANALIGDYFTGEARSKWLAVQSGIGSITGEARSKWLAVQSGIGSILSTLIVLGAGLLGTLGWYGPIYLYALAIPVFIGLCLFTAEPATRRRVDSVAGEEAVAFPRRKMAAIGLITLASAILYFLEPLQISQVFSQLGLTSSSQIGIATAVAGIGVPLGAWLYGRNARQRVDRQFFLFYAIFGLGLLFIAVAHNPLAGVAAAFVAQVGNGMLIPLMLAWMMKALPAPHRATGIGIWHTFFFLGMFISPVLMTLLNGMTGSMQDSLLLFALLTLAIAGATGIASARMGGRRALAR
ncbi:MFS transporter [Klebsiella quasipneumoniae]|uniref:MFS transporter n=3 Tax=Klebsiella quasipneumoniae TaxID=1463165 RepID=UPI0034DE894A